MATSESRGMLTNSARLRSAERWARMAVSERAPSTQSAPLPWNWPWTAPARLSDPTSRTVSALPANLSGRPDRLAGKAETVLLMGSDSRAGAVNGQFQGSGADFVGGGCSVATVEALTGDRVDHYVEVDFAGFQSMVSALGGVDVCLPSAAVDVMSGLTLPAGVSHVDGEQALAFVRARDHSIGPHRRPEGAGLG